VSNSQWHADQSIGDAALREWEKKRENLAKELECAKAFHKVAVAERNYERARYDLLLKHLDNFRRTLEDEADMRTATRQPAQAALLCDVIDKLAEIIGFRDSKSIRTRAEVPGEAEAERRRQSDDDV